jgi:hypothetical protein
MGSIPLSTAARSGRVCSRRRKSWSLTSTFDDAGVSVAHVSTRIAVWVALVERTPLPR